MRCWSPLPEEAQKAQWLGALLSWVSCVLGFSSGEGQTPPSLLLPSFLLCCDLVPEACSQLDHSQSPRGVPGLHRNPHCWGPRPLSSFCK